VNLIFRRQWPGFLVDLEQVVIDRLQIPTLDGRVHSFDDVPAFLGVVAGVQVRQPVVDIGDRGEAFFANNLGLSKKILAEPDGDALPDLKPLGEAQRGEAVAVKFGAIPVS